MMRAAIAPCNANEPANPPPNWAGLLEVRSLRLERIRDIRGYVYFAGEDSSGCVTMLMLVIPARLTASITEAKAPKGTRSSART
jgi:hypothetical protein